jgi:hypothetical protein
MREGRAHAATKVAPHSQHSGPDERDARMDTQQQPISKEKTLEKRYPSGLTLSRLAFSAAIL